MVQGWNSNSMFNAFSLSLSGTPKRVPLTTSPTCPPFFTGQEHSLNPLELILYPPQGLRRAPHSPSTHICSSSWNSILSSPAPSSMVPTAPSCPLSQLVSSNQNLLPCPLTVPHLFTQTAPFVAVSTGLRICLSVHGF